MDKKKVKKKSADEMTTRILDAMKSLRILSSKNTYIVSVSFVDAKEMRSLNARFRGKRRATDVLSFEQPQDAETPLLKRVRFLGDIVVCTPVARKQARERKHSLEVETAVLLVHGILHLLGFDHEKGECQADLMQRLEAKVLAKLKIRQNAGLIARGAV